MQLSFFKTNVFYLSIARKIQMYLLIEINVDSILQLGVSLYPRLGLAEIQFFTDSAKTVEYVIPEKVAFLFIQDLI